MDLLLAIKQLYTLLKEHDIVETVPSLEELEKIADDLYDGKDKKIKQYSNLPLNNEIISQIAKIKEIITNEKTNN